MGNISFLNIFLLILAICGVQFCCDAWHMDTRPRIFGSKIPLNSILPSSKKVQQKIVKYHNFFRSNVVPTAADMLTMSWHKGAAEAAQKWADRCLQLDHDTASGRWITNYGSCGQNIFLSTHHVPWFFAVKMWYMEKHNFTYGSPHNSLSAVGHYTQLVWSATHKVGCGFAQCKKPYIGKPYFSYVCNYCPIGNHDYKLGRPYKRGEPCSSCKKQCRINKLCTNSCPAADMWVNCQELYRVWPKWLCNTSTYEGKERRENCKATCTCQDRIK